MAIKANLVIDQGSSFSADINLTDTDGSVYDLSGYTVASQMRKSYAAENAVTFSATHSGVEGTILLSLTSSATSDLTPGRYLYDIEITSPGGLVSRVIEGIVTVTPGITRI